MYYDHRHLLHSVNDDGGRRVRVKTGSLIIIYKHNTIKYIIGTTKTYILLYSVYTIIDST